MILTVTVRKIKSFLLLILSYIRRCFCCFRKRQNSNSELPITISSENGTQVSSSENTGDKMDNWDSWDVPSAIVSDGGGRHSTGPKLSPLQQQIQDYRYTQQRKMQETPLEPEPEPNYFQDLAPSIEKTPQQMVILQRPEEEQQVSNRLSFSLTDPLLQSSELGEWTEEGAGWEDTAEEEDLDSVIKDQRQQERERRRQEQLRRKHEKELQRKSTGNKLATKIN